MKNKKIRFAPLIRVSTERQEEQGESLHTQRKRIIKNVQDLGGVILDHCWKYSGQEHATPDFRQERKMFDRLLEDSGKGLFDAVIVDDCSRWSRDVLKSKQALGILQKNNIEFYIGTSKHDFYSPEQEFTMDTITGANQLSAKIAKKKSLLNRIERANRGHPTCGKRPFGRTFNKDTGEWGIDKEKQKGIQWGAEQYLKGESKEDIAKKLGMSAYNLWKVLTKRCGDTWTQTFNSDELNIHETVIIRIPRLLSQETIDAIHKQIRANKTYTHGHIKHKYLMSRMIFCGHCGYALCGYTKPNGRQYYRHADKIYRRQCSFHRHVPADDIERGVLVHLFQMYGDVANFEKAMFRAIPNREENEQLIIEKENYEKELVKLQNKINRIVDAIGEGTICNKDAKKNMNRIKEREALLNSEIQKIKLQAENIPTKKQINYKAKKIKRILKRIFSYPDRLANMSFDDRRKILQMAFEGTDAEEKRLGVYVEKSKDSNNSLNYTIKGIAGNLEDSLPISLAKVQGLFGISPLHDGNYDPFTDSILEEKEDKLDVLSTHQHYFCRKCNRACCP